MKLTFVQVEEARQRVMWGESARSVARLMGVTEGALRHHFRKGTHPTQLRTLSLQLAHALEGLEALDVSARAAAERLRARRKPREI